MPDTQMFYRISGAAWFTIAWCHQWHQKIAGKEGFYCCWFLISHQRNGQDKACIRLLIPVSMLACWPSVTRRILKFLFPQNHYKPQNQQDSQNRWLRRKTTSHNQTRDEKRSCWSSLLCSCTELYHKQKQSWRGQENHNGGETSAHQQDGCMLSSFTKENQRRGLAADAALVSAKSLAAAPHLTLASGRKPGGNIFPNSGGTLRSSTASPADHSWV